MNVIMAYFRYDVYLHLTNKTKRAGQDFESSQGCVRESLLVQATEISQAIHNSRIIISHSDTIQDFTH